MKQFVSKGSNIKTSLCNVLLFSTALLFATGCIKRDHPEPKLEITKVASGLVNPIGIELDESGRVWVAESGSGHNDGKILMIANGKKYDVITNFESTISESGETDGPTHLLFNEGMLYVLGTGGKMYKANVHSFKPGDAPKMASSLAVEKIGDYVLKHNFTNKTGESHPYNFVKAPNGSIYITDAGANAIIRRDPTGALSILTEVPGIPNPTPGKFPLVVQSVPTGIIYDNGNFLVTTLLGFPFPAGKSIIYKISLSGDYSIFQQGFTSLVDIAEGGSHGHLVLEHGVFGAMGFGAKTGRLLWADGKMITPLATGLNTPAGLKQANEHCWYVTSIGDSSLLKVTY